MSTSDTNFEFSLRGMAQQANPAFAAGSVFIPILALLYAVFFAPIQQHTYVHVIAGALWMGFDLYMGMVLGPVTAGMDAESRADFFKKFTPKSAFLMPTIATVTIIAGMTLAQRHEIFPTSRAWMAVFTGVTLLPVILSFAKQHDYLDDVRTYIALGIAILLTAGLYLSSSGAFTVPPLPIAVALALVALTALVGFGGIFPGEIRVYREMASENPDAELIGEIGMRNAKLGLVAGLLQLSIILVMVYVRFLSHGHH